MLVLAGTPHLRQGSSMREGAFEAIKELDTKYVRYLPFGPYPRLSVAELQPPTKEQTSWDFSLLDPEMIRFMEITKGREPIVCFSEAPAWMFKTRKPATYLADPNELDWPYFWAKLDAPEGSPKVALVDPTGKQLADYYARIFSWYAKGGFTDENGKYHHSGYHYDIPWWGVLNEVDGMGPEQYTRVYDAVVTAIRKISPNTRFVGLALSGTGFAAGTTFGAVSMAEFFEYFLNSKNHLPDMPLDMISYHFYAIPSRLQTLDSWQYTFFDQADGFLVEVEFIEAIRKRLSPSTLVYLDELGTILFEDLQAALRRTCETATLIPALYWNLSSALYAYLFLETTKRGIDIVAESELTGNAEYFPSASMMDWQTGRPNARYRVLRLLTENFGPGNKLALTSIGAIFAADVAVQAFVTAQGRKLLVINKRKRSVEIDTEAVGPISKVSIVDGISADGPARDEVPQGKKLRLGPFAVAVATISG